MNKHMPLDVFLELFDSTNSAMNILMIRLKMDLEAFIFNMPGSQLQIASTKSVLTAILQGNSSTYAYAAIEITTMHK
ncbi:hypothetical protein FRX31_029194 [Thalictrum thalictroides]|uniref:Uncharacterized protein n=1 Tax=Thalictrum thalictroides TaxID=46969 RepID=A0A7J6VA23_THATH|nr:hypothetical protein FRX31_029194 [Thalictrum thalictroides]